MPSTQKWKKPRLLLSKSFSQEVSFQESGYDSILTSKDKDHKNLPVSPFLPRANSRVDH